MKEPSHKNLRSLDTMRRKNTGFQSCHTFHHLTNPTTLQNHNIDNQSNRSKSLDASLQVTY